MTLSFQFLKEEKIDLQTLYLFLFALKADSCVLRSHLPDRAPNEKPY